MSEPASLIKADEPLVTVLIPAYNARRFLLETLESVSAQTYGNVEILVVDDGSTDETPGLLAEYTKRDNRLYVLRQVNGGICAALNAGLALAKGAFIARIDSDDVMEPERLARQIAFLHANPAIGFCASSITFIDDRSRVIGEMIHPVDDLNGLAKMIRERKTLSFTGPTATFRSEPLRAIGGFNAQYQPCEDLDIMLRLHAAGYPGVALPEKLLRYRLHSNSLSANNALRQVRLRNFLFYNFFATLDGRPTVSFESFLTRGSRSQRAATEWRDRADALQQVAGYHRADGRPIAGYGLLAVALLMKLNRLPQKITNLCLSAPRGGGA